MRFATDIVAVNLRDYSHSPALLADLAREGYELFNPEGHVFFRKHVRLESTPVAAIATDVPAGPPAIDYDALASSLASALGHKYFSAAEPTIPAPVSGDGEGYGPECGDEGRDDGPDD